MPRLDKQQLRIQIRFGIKLRKKNVGSDYFYEVQKPLSYNSLFKITDLRDH
jgi:hypothetical protein